METTVQIIHLLILAFGLAVGYWSGVIKERDRQERRRRADLRARYGRATNH